MSAVVSLNLGDSILIVFHNLIHFRCGTTPLHRSSTPWASESEGFSQWPRTTSLTTTSSGVFALLLLPCCLDPLGCFVYFLVCFLH